MYTFQQRYNALLAAALGTIDKYKGKLSGVLSSGQRYIDNDDALILIGNGNPMLRDKRDQRLVNDGYKKEKNCDDEPLSKAFEPTQIISLADRLVADILSNNSHPRRK